MPSIKIKHNCSQKDKFKNLSQERKNVNLKDKTKDIKGGTLKIRNKLEGPSPLKIDR